MNTHLHYQLAGLGQITSSQIGHSIVGTALTTAAAFDPEPISKAILGVAAVIQNFFFQPDLKKIATTQIVNKAEQLVQQNLQAWQSLPASEKTVSTQQAALSNFDQVWQEVVSACEGTGQYGSAGQACVNDRKQGACHYQANGQCWNWFVGYRDPIANDPQVVANVAAAAVSSVLPTSVTSALSSAGISPTMLLLAGAAVLLVVVAS